MKQALTSVAAILSSALCAAQEPAADDPPQISREQWQARVKASQQHAATMGHEHGSVLPPSPSPDQMAEEASEQALKDEALLPGDIVSTNRGLFQFRGSPDRERKPDDFIRIR